MNESDSDSDSDFDPMEYIEETDEEEQMSLCLDDIVEIDAIRFLLKDNQQYLSLFNSLLKIIDNNVDICYNLTKNKLLKK